ncbi:Nn.00g056010.m01.CDS01 [Neocucurbitaria sp. VM-36]
MDTKEIAEVVSSKALLRSGLIFRGLESGVDDNNIRLHISEILELVQTGKDAEGPCPTCRGYGLEYLHLLECPATIAGKEKYDKTLSPYRSSSPGPDDYVPEGEAYRPVPNRDTWLQCFDTRSHFQDDCVVCELLVSLLPQDSTGPWRICWVGYGYYKMADKHKSLGRKDAEINWKTQRTPGIVVAPDQSADFEEWWAYRRQHGLVLPTRRRDEDSTIPRARYLDSYSVDFNAAKSWIRTCSEQHGDSCGNVEPTFSSLKVIDCRTKTVVRAPASCQYVALSYVWGTNHVTTPRDLSNWDRVPTLIQDAVIATIKLGYNYLWVDFYCIPQDDASEMQRQIRSMDRIYLESEVTIIAACSENAATGLSGVSNNIRQRSTKATVGRNTLVAIYSQEAESVVYSKWNTRAWTYQEGVLSRRRLMFTDTGTYFQCASGNSGESCASEALDVALGTQGLRSITNDSWIFLDIRSLTKLPDMVWTCLNAYTEKESTFDSDALNAFTGILTRFAETSETFNHIWGVPVYRKLLQSPILGGGALEFIKDYKVRQTYSEQLASSLLWQPAKANFYATYRDEFPTWSWANDTGKIKCEGQNVRNLDLDISIELENREKLRAETFFSLPVEQRPNIAKGLYIDAPTTYVHIHPVANHEGKVWTVTSFERQDSLDPRYLGLMSIFRWAEHTKLGRHLAIILGASQSTRSDRLTYHLLVLLDKETHYERGFVLEVNDATLEKSVPEDTWTSWREDACDVLKNDTIPFIWADLPADLGFTEEKRDDWEKVFLIAKHLHVKQRAVYLR